MNSWNAPIPAVFERTPLWIAAEQIRRDLIAHNGAHLASCLSCVDILAALYLGGGLRVRHNEPDWPGRDRFILSKGHAALALYFTLQRDGFDVDPKAFHPACHIDRSVCGVEVTTGSLGHGLSIGAGMALADRSRRVVVLLGDGECWEGAVWETAMFASHHRLANLVAIVDRNRISATGWTEQAVALDPLPDRWRAFGWSVTEPSGVDPDILRRAMEGLSDSMPTCIVAHTTKGRGVRTMENNPLCHSMRLPEASYANTT